MYFGYGWDNGWTIYLDDDHYVNKFIVNQVNNGTFNQYGNANKWYPLLVKISEMTGGFGFNLKWSSSPFNYIQIPMQYVYLPTLVSPSPFNINVIQTVWGDSKRTGTEEWDDGNTSNGDGWNHSWNEETGFGWYGGNTVSIDTWEAWGDSVVNKIDITAWDDGNTSNGDGCSNHWHVEAGWTWTGGSTSSVDTWNEIWGDGMKFNSVSTYWDDGNKTNGDGCDSSWNIEADWTWNGGSSSKSDTCTNNCGDGKTFSTNVNDWDDGNLIDGDGWSSIWKEEANYGWYGGTHTSPDSWEIWGNGIINKLDSTAWDDGNTNPNDGCSSNCHIETGWTWTGGSITSKDTCTEIWGDGKRFNNNSAYWDDGNTSNGDGWDSNWNLETGWTCSGGTTTQKDTWIDFWGDGKKYSSETDFWDDGNTNDNDGWNSSWAMENGWIWTGGSSTSKDIWRDIWGDGFTYVSNSTFWDDGNTSSNDGWDSNWSKETGWTWSGGSTTTADTWKEIWGDGIRFNSNNTYCDDSNTINGDGWSSSWSIEKGWKCSGGSTTTADTWKEICGDGIRFNTNSTYWDDGNEEDIDGCNSSWMIEKNYKWYGGSSTQKDNWDEIINEGKLYHSD